MKAPAVVFDLDGTLVDSQWDLVPAVEWVLARLGHPPRSHRQIASFVGRGAKNLVRRSLPDALASDDAAVEAALALFKQRYTSHLADRTRAYPGVEEALRELTEQGVACSVLTNKPGDMARRLMDALGLSPFMVGVWGAGDIPALKPDPRGLLEVFGTMKVEPGAAWYVGDMPIDVQAARSAGCRAAGVTWGYCGEREMAGANPDRVLGHPRELDQLVGG